MPPPLSHPPMLMAAAWWLGKRANGIGRSATWRSSARGRTTTRTAPSPPFARVRRAPGSLVNEWARAGCSGVVLGIDKHTRLA